MKNIFKKLGLFLTVLVISACGNDGDGDDKSPGFAPGNLNNMRLILVENGNTNRWLFSADAANSGQARLEGVGTFNFSYSLRDGNRSTIIFEVGGQDRYDMTWTSETQGTFEQSFNGGGTSSGSFSIEDASGETGSVSFLSLTQKFGGAITQPKITLTGNIANDFEVLDAGYWQSGSSIRFVNGIVTMRYIGNNSVTPTAVVVRLKDGSGNDIGLKIPVVNSSSETQYTISGASTFLKNVVPLTFNFTQEVNLGGGASVNGSVDSQNNNVYAQGAQGRDIVSLVQLLRQGADQDFRGNFSDLTEIELFYFTQTENINNSNAFIVQRYFDNNGSAVSAPTGTLEITQQATYDTNNALWSFELTNTSEVDVTGSFDFLAQSTDGTGVGVAQESNIQLNSGQSQVFQVRRSDLNQSLSFLSETEFQNLDVKILLDW